MAGQGRPSKYSEELATAIIDRMLAGESVRSICLDPAMPSKATVMLWAASDREGFSDRYAKGCEARALHLAEELLDIADDESRDVERGSASVSRDRLRVDTRKWILSKLVPRYSDGNKSGADTTNSVDNQANSVRIEIVDARKRQDDTDEDRK